MELAVHRTMFSPEELQQSLTTASLEAKYEKSLRQTESIYEQEICRTLRVRILLIEDDNDVLQEQLAEADYVLVRAEGAELELRDQLVETEGHLQHKENEVRAKLREIENLKAELNSLNSVSKDSTKLLMEKLALTREVSNLKPEIEHLRSQATSHQSVLSEKLALQRQLSSVQVELETERRALQRTQAKESKQSEEDAKLEAQLDDLRKELSKEKRENQRREKEAKKEATEWAGQKSIFESKLDAFRGKLRTTKEQLKEAQTELQDAQASAQISRQGGPEGNASEANDKKPRKRTIARFDPDATIGTPGAIPAAKRNKRSSTLPGDKSTFSITPFLNRTTSVAPESPKNTNAPIIDEGSAEADEVTTAKENVVKDKDVDGLSEDANTIVEKTSSVNKMKAGKTTVLQETTAQRTNSKAEQPRKPPARTMLAKVAEESNDENEVPREHETRNTVSLAAEPKPKKKHKLLGGKQERSTLFDEDDVEATNAGRKVLLGGGRGFGLRGGGALLSSKGNLHLGLGKGKGSFAEFSPLKKDRKTVAS